MKLARYMARGIGDALFGLVIGDRAVSFRALARAAGGACPGLSDMGAYLRGLPGSEDAARRLQDYALEGGCADGAFDARPVGETRFLSPLDPPALLDFGLSPRHLSNSSKTLLRRSYGGFVAGLIGPFVRRRIRRMAASSVLPYYKCNHLAIIGDEDEAGWPSYSSYLDVEPELAFVAGTPSRPIAGYLIFDDLSARDVQLPEMLGTGPSRSKDFSRSKGLGPFLVTPDDVADPLALGVSVRVKGAADGRERISWSGSTSEYSRRPEEVASYLGTIFTPAPGTVIGMGTIPGCTGLDNDEWLLPGDSVEIAFEALGALRLRLPERIGPLKPSPWGRRRELDGCYEG